MQVKHIWLQQSNISILVNRLLIFRKLNWFHYLPSQLKSSNLCHILTAYCGKIRVPSKRLERQPGGNKINNKLPSIKPFFRKFWRWTHTHTHTAIQTDSLMFVPCILEVVEMINDMHWLYHSFILYILTPTCFGSSLPSSGSFLDPSELPELQMEWVVYMKYTTEKESACVTQKDLRSSLIMADYYRNM
jgi:hypothetical protein